MTRKLQARMNVSDHTKVSDPDDDNTFPSRILGNRCIRASSLLAQFVSVWYGPYGRLLDGLVCRKKAGAVHRQSQYH